MRVRVPHPPCFCWGLIIAAAGLFLLTSTASAQIAGVPTSVAGFVGQSEFGPLDTPVLVTGIGEFEATFGAGSSGLTNPHLARSVTAFFNNGGSRAWIVRVFSADDASLIGTPAGPATSATGLAALESIEEIGLLAISGATSAAVHNALLDACENQVQRFCLLDPANRTSVPGVLAERAGLDQNAGNAALYYPWMRVASASGTVDVPPSGFVAGVIARTDLTRGVWSAPAGTTAGSLVGAVGLTDEVTTTETSQLSTQHVNPIRSFSGLGILIWGARTVSLDPEWRFISVRRLANFIEASVTSGTTSALAVPNTPPLWAALEADVAAFLQSLFLNGAFQGVSSSEAYFVRCDATTMTAQDIEEGRTTIQLGFAALAPAEFTVLEIVIQRPTAVPGLVPLGTVVLLALTTGAATRRLRPTRSSPDPVYPPDDIRSSSSNPGS